MSREVTLKGPHVHEGKQYQAGDKITMSDDDAKWYDQMVLERRRLALANPVVAAMPTNANPGDPSASPDAPAPEVNSDGNDAEVFEKESKNTASSLSGSSTAGSLTPNAMPNTTPLRSGTRINSDTRADT